MKKTISINNPIAHRVKILFDDEQVIGVVSATLKFVDKSLLNDAAKKMLNEGFPK